MLSMACHNLTGNKSLIFALKKMKIGIFYDDVLDLLASWAHHEYMQTMLNSMLNSSDERKRTVLLRIYIQLLNRRCRLVLHGAHFCRSPPNTDCSISYCSTGNDACYLLICFTLSTKTVITFRLSSWMRILRFMWPAKQTHEHSTMPGASASSNRMQSSYMISRTLTFGWFHHI